MQLAQKAKSKEVREFLQTTFTLSKIPSCYFGPLEGGGLSPAGHLFLMPSRQTVGSVVLDY